MQSYLSYGAVNSTHQSMHHPFLNNVEWDGGSVRIHNAAYSQYEMVRQEQRGQKKYRKVLHYVVRGGVILSKTVNTQHNATAARHEQRYATLQEV
jgi:hypothetical protein